MLVYCDVDDTVADVYSVIKRAVPGLTPLEYRPMFASQRTEKSKEVARLYRESPVELYRAVQPFPGSLDAVKSLKLHGIKVYYASHCLNGEMIEAKVQWLHRHGFIDSCSLTEFIPIVDKGLLRGHAILEDWPPSFEGFQGLRLLLDRPWNVRFNKGKFRRVSNWGEAADILVGRKASHEQRG